jgi:hypothetical protein
MSTLTTQSPFLKGENLPEKISLTEWLRRKIIENTEFVDIFRFLLDTGTLFSGKMPLYPPGLIDPYRVDQAYCHSNNLLYAAVIYERQPGMIEDVQFVSGIYGLQATDPSVPSDKKYAIAFHSFMSYRGMVLDCTMMEYPPLYYIVDQYFGTRFSIKTVVETLNKISDEALEKKTAIYINTPLEILKDKPYLK